MNLLRLDLVSLFLFTRIVRHGSISKGAEAAHLAVAAASRRVADLEEAVGTALLARHSRGVRVTQAGETLYRHALKVLGAVEALASDMADYEAGLSGVVRLWANTSAVTEFLPADLAAFTQLNPGIRLDMEEAASSEIVAAILDGRADVGIFADRTPAFGLQVATYREDRLVVVAPAGHPLAGRRSVAFEEALDYDFVTLSRKTSLALRLQDQTEQLSKPLRLRVQVRSFDAMCQMVAAGLGIAVLPEKAIRPHTRSMGLARVALTDDWARRELLIGARDLAALARPARLLVEHLRGGAGYA